MGSVIVSATVTFYGVGMVKRWDAVPMVI